MFFKNKTDPIKAAYEDRTYTIQEVRENFFPRKAYIRLTIYNFIMDIAVPFVAIICLIIGFSIGTVTKCFGNASEKYVHEEAEKVVVDVYEEDK